MKECDSTSTNPDTTAAATTVTIINPEEIETQEVQLQARDERGDSEVAEASQKLGELHVSDPAPQKVVFVPALFVFGGMDTFGTIHNDSFVLIPPV